MSNKNNKLIGINKHAHNKQIKSLAIARWDANTQGRFAIMPYVLSPLI